jgi:DNA (cytosine-5)-methyltransferase 1
LETSQLTAIDSFCGAGGLSLGLTGAGFDVRAAFDTDGPSVTTYAKNLGDHVFQGDANEVTGKELLSRASLSRRGAHTSETSGTRWSSNTSASSRN